LGIKTKHLSQCLAHSKEYKIDTKYKNTK
jgi:hypothetical protein